MFQLPHVQETKDNHDMLHALTVLDDNMHGLEDLKQRILQEVYVRRFAGGNKGGIILLYGPAGTGKTSCAKGIADSLDRKYAQVSLAR